MTQTPEGIRSMDLQANTRKTEMGLEVRLHSKAVNITVEIDLDYDKDYFLGIAENLVFMVEDQVAKYAGLEWTPDE
jgi:uncharacterized alkaline shock family protein YloU